MTFFPCRVIEKKNNLPKRDTKFHKKQVLLSKKETGSRENDKAVDVDNFVEIGDFFGILRGFSKNFPPKDVDNVGKRILVYPKRTEPVNGNLLCKTPAMMIE